MDKNKECKVVENLPPIKLPKKEWDWLFKEGYLTKPQIKFLKKAEAVGFEVDVNHFSRVFPNRKGQFKPYNFCKVVISKNMENKII